MIQPNRDHHSFNSAKRYFTHVQKETFQRPFSPPPEPRLVILNYDSGFGFPYTQCRLGQNDTHPPSQYTMIPSRALSTKLIGKSIIFILFQYYINLFNLQ